jgi:hypothetical protein
MKKYIEKKDKFEILCETFDGIFEEEIIKPLD